MSSNDVYGLFELAQKIGSLEIPTNNYDTNLMPSLSMYN